MTLLIIFILYALVLNAALARAGYRARRESEIAAVQTPVLKKISRILIIGATGGTGRELVKQALVRGYHVTALVRKAAKLKIKHERLKIVQGDVLDYDAVAAAMHGQEAVLSALGHKRFFMPTTILSTGTRNMLRAMQTHGIARFVCETSLGIGNSAGRMGLLYTFFTVPVILPFYFWDKAKQERLIAESSVDWTIVRPGVLINAKKRGHYRSGVRLGSFLRTVRIMRAEVAAFMLDQLESENFLRTAVAVAQ